MSKIVDLVKKGISNKIISCIAISGIILFIFFVLLYNNYDKIDSSYIIAKLEKSSELTTIKLNYTGMSEFIDSGVIIINRSDFIMVYEATARVGIDVKEIQVDVDNFSNIVWLTIPKAKILDVKVDSSKIKYFDEKFALFNIDSKEDVNKGIVLAEQEAKEELTNMGVLEMANSQAEALIKGLIQDVIPKGYTIKVR